MLFEYGKWKSIRNKDALKQLLLDIWQQEISTDPIEPDEAQDDSSYQPFLSFDGNDVRARNYVGFIQHQNELIEIYPKVFRHIANSGDCKGLMLQHIFFWFSYCRKWRFPYNPASLEKNNINDFPELIIGLMANQFLETVSKYPFTMYQHVEEVLYTPRGTINFNRYAVNNISRGSYQKIDCDYEPFTIDNTVNRVIKYCCRLLLNQAKIYENQRLLQETIFILDEVEDVPCTSHDIERIAFNPMFSDYIILMENCKLILRQQLYSHSEYDLSQWCLLFPMEYIFEDFIAGFLEDRFQKEWKVKYQKSDMFLATNVLKKNVFNMKHDIYLTSKKFPHIQVIVDTKYKIRNGNFKEDLKKGVDQNDLYQMVSYAFRRGCNNIVLLYPNVSESLNKPDIFEIDSGFEGHDKVHVTVMEVPFWSFKNFEDLESDLEKVLTNALNSISEIEPQRATIKVVPFAA